MIPQFQQKRIITSSVEPPDTNVLWLQTYPNSPNIPDIRIYFNGVWTTLTDVSTIEQVLNFTVTNRLVAKQINLELDGSVTPQAGDLYVNNQGELSFMFNDGTTLNIGKENWIQGENNTGTLLSNNKAVYVNGDHGNRPTFALASNNDLTKCTTVGVLTQDVPNGMLNGKATTLGVVNQFNTSGMIEGGKLWLGTNGVVTQTKPTSGFVVFIGYALNSTPNGSILVRIGEPLALDLSSNSDEIAPTVKAVANAITDIKDEVQYTGFIDKDPLAFINKKIAVKCPYGPISLPTAEFISTNTISQKYGSMNYTTYFQTGDIVVVRGLDEIPYYRTIDAVSPTVIIFQETDLPATIALNETITIGKAMKIITRTNMSGNPHLIDDSNPVTNPIYLERLECIVLAGHVQQKWYIISTYKP